ncbi:TetR family transcriptional regulator [Francisellaceae bacterium]|nr:TetR family transcriptional regulator [Francisellaceae bacterium]
MRDKNTKDKLLKAGLELFSEFGLEDTSTRMIAKKAGVNIAAIAYYFGGKEKLYERVSLMLINHLKSLIQPILTEIDSTIDEMSISDARNILLRLIKGISDATQNPDIIKFILLVEREQQEPTSVFKLIYDNFTAIIFKTITKCLKKIAPDKSDLHYILVSQSLLSHATLFLAYKTNILDSLKLDSFSDKSHLIHNKLLENHVLSFT